MYFVMRINNIVFDECRRGLFKHYRTWEEDNVKGFKDFYIVYDDEGINKLSFELDIFLKRFFSYDTPAQMMINGISLGLTSDNDDVQRIMEKMLR